ncbi:unnamed protein product, partial [Ixodes hexagonus]
SSLSLTSSLTLTHPQPRGMSYIATACGPNNAGFGEDTAGSFRAIRITTHEIAHA